MGVSFDLLQEAERLIRFNTVTWESNVDCAVYVGSLMRQCGGEVSYQESRVGETIFLNVMSLVGKGKDPVLLTTHLDTVAPGDLTLWTRTGRDPWKLTVRGNTLYGLGVADTKLDILCKLSAIASLPLRRLKRPILLLGTFGEESGLRGAVRFCQGDFPRPKMALVGEPTELALVTHHKGLAVLEFLLRSRRLHRPLAPQWLYEVSFQGKAAHSSTPALGANAIEQSLLFLKQLGKRFGKVALFNWGGGVAHNVIPDRATIRFSLGDRSKVTFASNRRQRVKVSRMKAGWYSSLPGEDGGWCAENLGKLLAPHQKRSDRAFQPSALTWNVTQLKEAKEGWTLTVDLRPLPGQSIHGVVRRLEEKLWKRLGPPGPSWQFRLERDNPALDLKSSEPLVKKAQTALRAIRASTRVATKVGCSEAGLFKHLGIPSLVFGPGRSVGNIHRPNEQMQLTQLKRAIRFYEAFLKRTCF